jgi:hypothetical protein
MIGKHTAAANVLQAICDGGVSQERSQESSSQNSPPSLVDGKFSPNAELRLVEVATVTIARPNRDRAQAPRCAQSFNDPA